MTTNAVCCRGPPTLMMMMISAGMAGGRRGADGLVPCALCTCFLALLACCLRGPKQRGERTNRGGRKNEEGGRKLRIDCSLVVVVVVRSFVGSRFVPQLRSSFLVFSAPLSRALTEFGIRFVTATALTHPTFGFRKF